MSGDSRGNSDSVDCGDGNGSDDIFDDEYFKNVDKLV